MSQLKVAYAEHISSNLQVTSSSYTTLSAPQLTAAAITSAGIAVGKKCLLIARGEFRRATATPGQMGIRFRHGTTEFSGSEALYTSSANGGDYLPWGFVTVWTVVSSEDLTLQLKSDGTVNAEGRFMSLALVKLSDDLTENTDWFSSESISNTTLTTSLQTGATITFTPAVGAERWLVVTDARIEEDTTADYFLSRMDRTGEATVGIECQQAGRANGDTRTFPHLYVATLGAVSQTFREQAKRVGTTAASARRTRSFVFAIDTAKLDSVAYAGNDGHDDLGTGTYAQNVQTVTHSQGVNGGTVLILGGGLYDPVGHTGQQYYTSRVQVDNIDSFSVDGVANTYTDVTGFSKFFYPGTGMSAQNYPWLHCSVETLASGNHTIDWDGNISVAATGRGVKGTRLISLSLESGAVPPAPGSGGGPQLERNEQIMYQSDYTAARRRVMVRCVDATDNVTPEAGEAGGQPTISKNGGAFASTNVGVLVAVDASNGLYYSEIAAAGLSDLGSLRMRYKTAATALFTVTLAVEECPWLDDGTAQAGAAGTITLRSGGPTIVPGSIVRLTGETGAGQSQIVTSFATAVATMEQNWTTTPDSTTTYVVLPGLPPTTPNVNSVQIDSSATAAQRLKAGALAIKTFAVVSGTNTTTTVTCDLPVTVGGVATPTDFYAGRTAYPTSGKLDGDEALITGSVVSGANTVLTVQTLSAAPTVGMTFTLS